MNKLIELKNLTKNCPEAEVLSAERGQIPRGQVVPVHAAPQPELRGAGRQEEFPVVDPLAGHPQNISVKMDACVQVSDLERKLINFVDHLTGG